MSTASNGSTKKSCKFSGLETADSLGNNDSHSDLSSDHEDEIKDSGSDKITRTLSNMSDNMVYPNITNNHARFMSQFIPITQMTHSGEFLVPVAPIAHTSSTGPVIQSDSLETPSFSEKKPQRLVLNESGDRVEGTLKFYNENKGFGFISIDRDGSEIFLHCDDLLKANIDIRPVLRKFNFEQIKFSFRILDYMGKYKKSRKVIDISLAGNY